MPLKWGERGTGGAEVDSHRGAEHWLRLPFMDSERPVDFARHLRADDPGATRTADHHFEDAELNPVVGNTLVPAEEALRAAFVASRHRCDLVKAVIAINMQGCATLKMTMMPSSVTVYFDRSLGSRSEE